MNKAKDYGFEVLDKIYNDISPKFSKFLLKQCYEIEKESQYETDRNQVLLRIQKSVEDYLKKEMKN